jgi:hypothetical protein
MSIPIPIKVGRMNSLGKNIMAAIGAKRNKAIPRAIPMRMGLSFIVAAPKIAPFHQNRRLGPLIDKDQILLSVKELSKIRKKPQQIPLSFEIEI